MNTEEKGSDPNKKKKKTKVYSEAFPPSELGTRDKLSPVSEVHSLVSNIKIDPSKIIFKTLTHENVIEIKNLHKEWFPIDYDDKCFEVVIKNESSSFYSQGAFYTVGDKEIILGSIMVDFQNASEKFKNHSSPEILEKISNEISFIDEMSCTLTFNDYICAYIMTIGVIDECRRMHLGTQLINKAIEKCLQNELCVCLYLDVIIYNEGAIKFYNKNNFEEVTTIKNYYRVYKNLYDAKVFVKIFTKKEKENYRNKNYSKFYQVFQYISLPFHFLICTITLNLCCKCFRKKHKLE